MSSKSSTKPRRGRPKGSTVSKISQAEQTDFEAWRASRFDGRTQSEIAKEIGCKLATFRSRVHRHQDRLRRDDLSLQALDLMVNGADDAEVQQLTRIGHKALVGLRMIADDYDHFTADE